LLLLSFILKLTIETLFYSIYLLHKRIVFNLSLTLLLVFTKTTKFHHITPFFKSLHLLKKNQIQGSLSLINLSKLVNLLTSALFSHSFTSLYSAFFSYHHCPSLTSRFKIANRSFFCSYHYYHSAPVMEQSAISSTSGFSSRQSISYFKLAVSDLSTSLFFMKLKNHLSHSSFSP